MIKENILFHFLLLGLILSFTTCLKAQNSYNHVFNPLGGFVHESEKPLRDELCLNGKWQFMPVFETDMAKFSKPVSFTWDTVPLKVPSPWNLNSFTNGEGGDFISYPSYPKLWEEAQMGWLKKDFTLPESWAGKKVKLHFEAIAGFAKIYVNGRLVGENLDIFFPTEIDVTTLLKKGTNEVLVGVAKASLTDDQGKYGRRNYVAGSFWGQHIAGIWQDVSIIVIPELSISDVFVQPDVQNDLLTFVVSIKNHSKKNQSFTVNASIRSWEKPVTNDINMAPVADGVLKNEVLQIENASKFELKAGDSIVIRLSKKVNGSLKKWTPESPNLYGAVISLKTDKKVVADTKYTRFGWRQFTIKGTELLLNDKPIVLKGDSWHFMGIPQMTRRYAWAWFKMLKDANANAVRLHAQPYPTFYLDMADEMGICVLDETGIWSSDGGPKIDSEIYWEACRGHVKGLVLRDRNHPSVFGWSVCNETLPVTKHVFNAPQELINRNIEEINKWVAITRATDPTRQWISGDGETQENTDLPTIIGHYGGEQELKRWSGQGKPWGIGETGMAYYGTPSQVSKINGDRAYESQEGRMEGLAGEAFDLISMQRDHFASYTSVFNLAWYGLKPLALGLSDITKSSTINDGIHFEEYVEGKPGYQPERLGPYTSTFNPGYDPDLPLYEPWPLFYAVKAAYSDNYKNLNNKWKQRKDNTVKVDKPEPRQSMVWLSKEPDELKKFFENMAIKFEPLTVKQDQLILIDGVNPPPVSTQLVENIKMALQEGSTVLVWGANKNSKLLIEALTENQIEFYERNATSYIIKGQHAILNGFSNAGLYFSEMTKQPISFTSIGGQWVLNSQLLLEACQTDWQKWNYQGEDIKTARILRNEQEEKAPGNLIVRQGYGKGEIIVSTIDLFALGNQARFIVRQMIGNLGGTFKGQAIYAPEALNSEGVLKNANFYGSVKNDSREIELVFTFSPLTDEEFANVKIGTITKGKYWDMISSDTNGIFNFLNLDLKEKNYASAYLSFWIFSPRSLTDLLVEPDMPRLDMHFGVDDALAFNINGKPVKQYLREGGFAEDELTFEGVPLEKGWNHVLIKVGQATGEWKCKIRFSSTDPSFLKEIRTVVDR